VALASVGVANAGTTDPSGTPTTTTPTATGPTGSPSATPTGEAPVEVHDARLRWGLSNEANNAAFAPGTYNFFSAGKIPNPGQGGVTIAKRQWRQASGDVAIQKWNGSSWTRATWTGLSTDAAGTPITSPLDGRFSGHQVVFSHGTGTVDLGAGTAHLSWDGDVTILFYSGMSFFYLSDPRLDVADGRGTLTGTLSGFASSQTDTSVWKKVPPKTVTLAELPDLRLAETGTTVQPAYDGIRVTGVPQVTAGTSVGSFPQSWVDFMKRLGTAAFWYSSGSATDAFKAALPVNVGFHGAPPPPPPSTPTPSTPASTTPHPSTTTASTTAAPSADPTARTQLPGASPPTAPPPAGATSSTGPPSTGGPMVGALATAQLVASTNTAAPPALGPRTRSPDGVLWLVGVGLLALAGAVAVRTHVRH
jgi:hypothetical protein